jgi:hypothetical protein
VKAICSYEINPRKHPTNYKIKILHIVTVALHRVASSKAKYDILCYIQSVPGGKNLTSGECSLGQTIPI